MNKVAQLTTVMLASGKISVNEDKLARPKSASEPLGRGETGPLMSHSSADEMSPGSSASLTPATNQLLQKSVLADEDADFKQLADELDDAAHYKSSPPSESANYDDCSCSPTREHPPCNESQATITADCWPSAAGSHGIDPNDCSKADPEPAELSSRPTEQVTPSEQVDAGEQRVELRFLVRRREAGALIGKRGSNIKRLRETFSTSTFSIPDTGNGPERVVCLTTSSKSLDLILEDFGQLFLEKSPENDDQIELKLLIHSSQAGTLIGVAGQSIKKLRNDSRAAIKIYELCCPLSSERVCAVKAKPSTVVGAIKLIRSILAETPLKGSFKPYDALNFDLNLTDKYGGYMPEEHPSTFELVPCLPPDHFNYPASQPLQSHLQPNHVILHQPFAPSEALHLIQSCGSQLVNTRDANQYGQNLGPQKQHNAAVWYAPGYHQRPPPGNLMRAEQISPGLKPHQAYRNNFVHRNHPIQYHQHRNQQQQQQFRKSSSCNNPRFHPYHMSSNCETTSNRSNPNLMQTFNHSVPRFESRLTYSPRAPSLLSAAPNSCILVPRSGQAYQQPFERNPFGPSNANQVPSLSQVRPVGMANLRRFYQQPAENRLQQQQQSQTIAPHGPGECVCMLPTSNRVVVLTPEAQAGSHGQGVEASSVGHLNGHG